IGPGAEEAVPGLIAVLGDANGDVRANAAEALSQIERPSFLERHMGASPEALAAPPPTLQIGLEAVPGLRAGLGDANENVRVSAAAALGRIGLSAVAAIRQYSAEAAGTIRAVTPDAEPVDAAVFAPQQVVKDSVFLIQVFLYPPGADEEVDDQASKMDAIA